MVQVKFQGVKLEISENRQLQPTRLSPTHLVPGSEFQNLKVEKLGFPHKTLKLQYQLQLQLQYQLQLQLQYQLQLQLQHQLQCQHQLQYQLQ
jgi:hypothetical protein